MIVTDTGSAPSGNSMGSHSSSGNWSCLSNSRFSSSVKPGFAGHLLHAFFVQALQDAGLKFFRSNLLQHNALGMVKVIIHPLAQFILPRAYKSRTPVACV